MLFTRCPDCETTFRVSDDALKKANGQVRCGRCASVFNAYAERRDSPVEPDASAEGPLLSSPSATAPSTEPAAAPVEAFEAEQAPPAGNGAAAAKARAALPSVKIANAAGAKHPEQREFSSAPSADESIDSA